MKALVAGFWLLVVGLLACSLASVWARHQVEVANKRVALAAEFDTLEALASGEGKRTEETLAGLREMGLAMVVLPEETLGDLIAEGRVRLLASSFNDTKQGATVPRLVLNLEFLDVTQIPRVRRALGIRFGGAAGRVEPRGSTLALPGVSAGLIRTMPIGLNPEQAALARTFGLRIIARCSNSIGLTDVAVSETIKWADELGANVFLAQGEQVLGRREALSTLIDTLEASEIYYASAEFARIGGNANVVAAMPENVLILHSAQALELDRLSEADAVERYARAARERNARILLVRPLNFSAEQPSSSFGAFLSRIRDQVQKEGGQIGEARPFVEPSMPSWLPGLVALMAMLLSAVTVRLAAPGARWSLVLGGLLILLGAAGIASEFARQVAALAAACILPIGGFLLVARSEVRSWPVAFLAITLLSLVAGLSVAGILNGLDFYIRAQEFRGIKVALFMPILFVGGLFFVFQSDWREQLKSPITWGVAALALGLAATFAFMLARTGNDTGAGAFPIELQVRNLLDAFLYVRPRTKEFLIGHPALVLGLAMYLNPGLTESARRWAILLLMLGVVGQTSIVNTLCHLHMPIALNLIRIGLGFVLGSIIGWGIWAVVSRLLSRTQLQVSGVS